MGQTIESFGGAGHGLWAAQLELMSLLEHNEELRTFLAGIQRDAATGLAELFLGIDPARDRSRRGSAGSVLHALFIGIMVKWFIGTEAGAARPRTRRGVADHRRTHGRQGRVNPSRGVRASGRPASSPR